MELPVVLIQSLHERHRCVQAKLEALVQLRQAECHLQAELTQIAALLACYPLPTPAPDPEEGLAQAEPVDSPSPAPGEASWSLPEVITQLLQDFGPGNTTYLQRQLRQVYGKDVAYATLSHVLKRGQAAKVYAYTHKQWRLRSRTRTAAKQEDV